MKSKRVSTFPGPGPDPLPLKLHFDYNFCTDDFMSVVRSAYNLSHEGVVVPISWICHIAVDSTQDAVPAYSNVKQSVHLVVRAYERRASSEGG